MSKARPRFVVQKHDATRLHYDFRLEIDGVLKSWVLPKGPSTNPRDKRLAIMTTDHSMSYGKFEGVIPKGEYGAGTVMLWDRGTYRNMKKNKSGKTISMKGCLRKGEIDIKLNGKKLKGGYALIRFQGKRWLFIKKRDEFANKGIKSREKSVKSGKTLKQIEAKFK